jgi:hypothetical protein
MFTNYRKSLLNLYRTDFNTRTYGVCLLPKKTNNTKMVRGQLHLPKYRGSVTFLALQMPPKEDGKLLGGGGFCNPFPMISLLRA